MNHRTELFKGSRGNKRPKVLIVGEAWGRDESMRGMAFVGASGRELDRMLKEAGFSLEDCLFTNLINERPPNNDMRHFFYNNTEVKKQKLEPLKGLYPKEKLKQALSKLDALIEATQPELIIACGNYSLWYLGDVELKTETKGLVRVVSGIQKWRGSQLVHSATQIPLLPILHPAAILRTYSMRWITVRDLKRGARADWTPPEYNFKVLYNIEDIRRWETRVTRWLESAERTFVVDLETLGLDIKCIGFGYGATYAECIPILTKDEQGNWKHHWSPQEYIEVICMLRRVLMHRNLTVVGQNFIYDLQYLIAEMLCVPKVKADTMLMNHVMFSQSPKSLEMLASLYCEHYVYWKDERKSFILDDKEDIHKGFLYCCEDCARTMEVYTVLDDMIDKDDQREQFNFLMEEFHLSFEMTVRGIKIDLDKRARMRAKAVEQLDALGSEIDKMLPKMLRPKGNYKAPWYKSNKQLAIVIYDYLLEPEIYSKAGSRTTDEEALQKISERNPLLKPVCENILTYRSLGVFHNTYLSAKLDSDGRARSKYNVGGTETFRWTSSKSDRGTGMNLQNIPRKRDD